MLGISKKLSQSIRIGALGVSLIVSASIANAENWPNWRGQSFDGISKETKLPSTWSDKQNIAWKLPMPGMGSSTPVIWNDKMFLTSVDGEDQVLLCISTEGKQLWKNVLAKGSSKVRVDEGNGASASCST
ncbi:MAG: hypothetical protein WCN64_11740, partial [Planctomycetota bacterium]